MCLVYPFRFLSTGLCLRPELIFHTVPVAMFLINSTQNRLSNRHPSSKRLDYVHVSLRAKQNSLVAPARTSVRN